MVMQTLHSEIEIETTPERVWAVLTDLDRFGEWNPFMTEARGTVSKGNRLRVRLSPPGGRGVTMKPRVTVAAPGRMFEWLGHAGFPGVFDGRHRFELRPTATGTTFVQHETFSGVLAPLFMRMLARRTAAGFVLMNEALKARAEQATAPTA
jgi:hypothetical protein